MFPLVYIEIQKRRKRRGATLSYKIIFTIYYIHILHIRYTYWDKMCNVYIYNTYIHVWKLKHTYITKYIVFDISIFLKCTNVNKNSQ